MMILSMIQGSSDIIVPRIVMSQSLMAPQQSYGYIMCSQKSNYLECYVIMSSSRPDGHITLLSLLWCLST